MIRCRESQVLCFDISKIMEILESAMETAYAKANAEWEQQFCDGEEEIKSSDFLMNFQVAQSSKAKIEGLKSSENTVRLRALRLRKEQRSQRQSQGDEGTTRMAATLPVPPLMNVKGGQLYALRIGV